ncbi:MAG: hypothetical protein ACKOYG_05830 [Ilumatobacteraceae bacterium]
MSETIDDAGPMRLGLLVLSLAAVVAAAVSAVAVDAPSARALPAEMSAAVGIPARVELDVLDSSCDNTGSTVEVSGSMSVLGQSVRIVLRNNVKGTHTATIVDELSVEVAPMDDGVEFPKQPVRGGVGGNPWISVQFESGGTVLTSPIIVGRCVQGASMHVRRDLMLPTDMALFLTTLDCSNKGSSLSIDASSGHAGLDAVLLFDNNINKVVHRRRAAAEATVSLAGDHTVRKGGRFEGAGGNPLVSAQFVDSEGAALGSETSLGRCNRLGA